ncbi:MAG: aminoacyl-tRNA hydrolase, partial [Planctomycetes bacterium]|nr:aminoacyl-tRNA hydrolase [Planctomycetota bacterium]
LGRRWGIGLAQEKFHAWFGRGTVADRDVILLKPTTFMNRSGQAVQATGRFYQLELSDLLVISDDLALPLGRLRFRARGGAGGHNGLQDIVDRLGGTEFPRLRLGIDSPVGDPAAFVLSRFGEADEAVVERACSRAADGVEYWVEHGTESAMNRCNADPQAE